MATEKLTINKCNYISIGALPTSYLNSLSYEEQLLWLSNYLENTLLPAINNCIEKVDSFDVDFTTIKEEITDIYEKITIINNDLSALKTEIYNTVDLKLKQQYSDVLKLMSDYQIIFNNNLSTLEKKLEDEIKSIELGNVKAYDPTTGQLVPISIALQNVYDASRQNAITCNEFEALDLTVDGFQAYEISAYNFDLNAKAILV